MMPTLKEIFEGAIGLGQPSQQSSFDKPKEDPESLALKDLISSNPPPNKTEIKEMSLKSVLKQAIVEGMYDDDWTKHRASMQTQQQQTKLPAKQQQPAQQRTASQAQGNPTDQMLSSLKDLEKSNSFDLVQSAGQWRKMSNLPKDQFDQTAMDLSRQGKITLHHHDAPHSLSPEDRDALIKDKNGNHYIGVATRKS